MKILIVDDEENLLKLIALHLKKDDREILTAKTGEEGLQIAKVERPEFVFCDIGLPDIDGVRVLKGLREIDSSCPVVMITAHGSIENAISSMKHGAYDYLQKPFEPEELEFVIERANRELRLRRDNERLQKEVSEKYDFSKILGTSSVMKTLFKRMNKAADTKSTVLITGESGTGKELIAKAIHFNSDRKAKPFVVVDCGAIPANLLESELFGHIKGAFTGADSLKKGLAEEAQGGSLFLDEIGEMPIELQSKLLRLLQESTIRRVGDTKLISLDIRIIAATNRDLELEVKEKRFREDLFYRLNVVPLRSPPLRERTEDISLLAQHFMDKYSTEYKRKISQISPQVIQRFLSYEWPGNVRQLENVIEQMVVMTEGQTLEPDTMPPPLSDSILGADISNSQIEWDLKKSLSKVQEYTEKFMIRRALDATDQNKTKAAELLGISRRALIYKAQEYKLGVSTEDSVDKES